MNKAYLLIILILMLSCVSNENENNCEPELFTNEIELNHLGELTFKAQILNCNSASMIRQGFVITNNISLATLEDSDNNVLIVNISGENITHTYSFLNNNSLNIDFDSIIYVRAFLENNAGVFYGNEQSIEISLENFDDDDGVDFENDNCPLTPNPSQTDSDGDGVGDDCDNCVDIPNFDQLDSDGDGIANACDNCPEIPNSTQLDYDNDNIGNLCDNCITEENQDQLDTDGDGIGDLCEIPTIYTNVNSIVFEETLINNISPSQELVLYSENIISEIIVSVSSGFEVSLDNISFYNTISFQATESTIIYIRFLPTEAFSYNSNLVVSNAELNNNVNIILSGSGNNIVNYQAFDSQALGFGGGFSQSATGIFNLHDDISNIESIKMYLQIDCPSTGCDDWDRFANIKVKNEVSGDWFEIGRYITPYWTGTQVLERGLEFDVTDFKSLLVGATELRIYIENWTTKADIISIDFDYLIGEPDFLYYQVSEVLSLHSNSIDCVPYGVSHNVDLDKSILIPAEAENSHLRTIISGWGHATPYDPDGRPCAEWCFRTHEVKINSSPTFQHYMGPIGCASNPINNEQNPGNWQPNRAGWCPGMVVPVRVNDLDPFLSGSPFIFEYDFHDWTNNGAGGNAFYAISTYVIVKSNTEINPAVIQD